ncbi:hypothetical protein LMA02_01875 [Burkholderia sp. B21-005]|uniref:hypothetical protein n=1 Tax=Burkholderia sp. lyk4-R2A-23 TaxID=3040284 RepID=UPI003306619F|nr:hypothetical protein LMA01_02325 [Burkholderia sp. B21-007]UEP42948.1 hypothetical protein LMA02_01875 [Burkholderia sp. B21-005]
MVCNGHSEINTDVRTEFNEAARRMRAAGVPEDVVRRAMRQNYKHFDCFGSFNAK